MIRSFIFSEGKLVGQDLELEALRLVRADKGLILWVDLDNPTDPEIKAILEGVFQFHPLAIEDCVTPSSLPKIEDYEEYLFIVMHAVDFSRADKFATTELDLCLYRRRGLLLRVRDQCAEYDLRGLFHLAGCVYAGRAVRYAGVRSVRA